MKDYAHVTVRKLAIERMKEHPQNPRQHPSPGTPEWETLKASLQHDYFDPAVWNKRNGFLVSGHLRTKILAEMGVRHVDCVVVDYPEDVHLARMIAANKQIGEWNDATLEALLRSCDTPALTGYTDQQIADLLGQTAEPTGQDAEPQIDRAEELRARYGVERGQVWRLGEHRLMCGDSMARADVERLTGGELLNIVVTSPPYNQKIDSFAPSGMHKEGGWVAKVSALAYRDNIKEPEYQNQQRQMLDLWSEFMAKNASFFYNHKNRFRDKIMISPLAWLPGNRLKIRQEIVWSRPGSVTQNARMFIPSDERIYWLYVGEDFHFDDQTEIKSWSSVWDINLETNKTHAVGYPVEIPLRCIRACSNAQETVGDPYVGSGTTLIAAERLGRKCRAMEIDPNFAAVALDRWAQATGRTPELAK